VEYLREVSVRLSVVLLIVALAGVLGGGALIGLPALGACLIFDSLCVGAWALLRDDGKPAVPQVHEVPALQSVLERARAS
jgi:hypothetical protein